MKFVDENSEAEAHLQGSYKRVHSFSI